MTCINHSYPLLPGEIIVMGFLVVLFLMMHKEAKRAHVCVCAKECDYFIRVQRHSVKADFHSPVISRLRPRKKKLTHIQLFSQSQAVHSSAHFILRK